MATRERIANQSFASMSNGMIERVLDEIAGAKGYTLKPDFRNALARVVIAVSNYDLSVRRKITPAEMLAHSVGLLMEATA